ncbi:MAG: adenosylhomocysteinase, partial [Clostridiales bacterium]|nr:adenosylhomocysteinase [Clostridiales bacterium]
MDYIIRDIGLAPEGEARINWVKKYMPLLNTLEREFIKDQPFKDKKVTVSVHLEAKTAYLALVLAAGGAEVAVTGSNPLSTQDP